MSSSDVKNFQVAKRLSEAQEKILKTIWETGNPVTRQEIVEKTGLKARSVNMHLINLRRAGLVKISGRGYIITEERKERIGLPKIKKEMAEEILSKRPLIEPRKDRDFESLQTFNTGAVVIDDKVHFLYRAVGRDYISRFGYANSKDGFHLDERLDEPVYEHKVTHPSFYSYISGGSVGGVEDPRIVRIEDTVYVTYTICDDGLGVALASIKVEDFLNKRWNQIRARIISLRGETHKNWVLFPEKIRGKYTLLHSISPRILISYFDDLEFEGGNVIRSYYDGEPVGEWKDGWEGWVKGVGPPPIKTDYGWLVFYHALHKDNLSGYCIGSMLLDIDNPTTILLRAKKPILTPWDIRDGVKPNIVYTCGAVVKNGRLLIYYGAADTKLCVAHANFDEFLENLTGKSYEGETRS
ncbi:MAG: hypothetical protein ACUVWK_06155 [Nitrososphaerales archaeon]